MQEAFKQQSIDTPNLLTQAPIKCSICQKQSLELLGLVCGHDVCIECASKSYFADNLSQQKQHKSGVMQISNSIFWCQICYEATIIQKNSIDMMSEFIKKKHKQKRISRQSMAKLTSSRQSKDRYSRRKKQKSSPFQKNLSKQIFSRSRSSSKFSKQKEALISSNLSKKQKQSTRIHNYQSPESGHIKNKQRQFFDDYLQLVKSHNILSSHTLCDSQKTKQYDYNRRSTQGLGTSNRSPHKSPYFTSKHDILKFPCNIHEDEQLGYFCYHCGKSLCPECAISGPHKSHEVLSIKRNSMKMHDYFQELICETKRYRQKLDKYIKDVEDWVENSMNMLNHSEQIIKNKFQSLHNILVQKQDQLLRDLKHKCQQDIKRTKKQSRYIHDLSKHAKKSQKIIHQIFKEEPNNWDILQLERQKQILEALNSGKLKESIRQTKLPPSKNVRIGLIAQAIQLIEELVIKFKLEIEDQQTNLK